MAHIVIYDKASADNPIVGIHSTHSGQERVDLQEVYPGADPNRYGVILIADEVIAQMTLRTYKRDRNGKLQMQSLLQDKTKDLVSVADSALGQNILVFGEPYAEIKSVTDLAGERVRNTAVNPDKGIIGLGSRAGYFTVICKVNTGVQAPEIVQEERNWDWDRDRAGNIVGMKLLKRFSPEPPK